MICYVIFEVDIKEEVLSLRIIDMLESKLKWLQCVHEDIRLQYKKKIVLTLSVANSLCNDELYEILICLPLSDKGLKLEKSLDENKWKVKIMFCISCYKCLKRKSKDKVIGPPKFSIANNWATGDLPDEISLHKLTYAEIRMVTRAPISSVIKVIGRNDKELKHHTMALLATPKPALLQVLV